jgi:SNF2 family DNA or RNA helicase
MFVITSEMAKKTRTRTIEQMFLSYYPGIILTSYQLFANMCEEFTTDRNWDYIILDEGHIVKNPNTKISKAVHEIESSHRMLLTGTPMQNHLAEFWALIHWVSKGSLLGSQTYFSRHFAEPIVKGQDPNASQEFREIAATAIQELLSLIRPILLQVSLSNSFSMCHYVTSSIGYAEEKKRV